MRNLAALRDAIRKLHGCESEHVRSVSIIEKFEGKTVWAGEVEVFRLLGHQKARHCYAWSHGQDDGSERFVAVLELPPVDSARKAVQAAIAAEARKGSRGSSGVA
jgi:hypothetical protein